MEEENYNDKILLLEKNKERSEIKNLLEIKKEKEFKVKEFKEVKEVKEVKEKEEKEECQSIDEILNLIPLGRFHYLLFLLCGMTFISASLVSFYSFTLSFSLSLTLSLSFAFFNSLFSSLSLSFSPLSLSLFYSLGSYDFNFFINLCC